jgi:hypothetical protein
MILKLFDGHWGTFDARLREKSHVLTMGSIVRQNKSLLISLYERGIMKKDGRSRL